MDIQKFMAHKVALVIMVYMQNSITIVNNTLIEFRSIHQEKLIMVRHYVKKTSTIADP